MESEKKREFDGDTFESEKRKEFEGETFGNEKEEIRKIQINLRKRTSFHVNAKKTESKQG